MHRVNGWIGRGKALASTQSLDSLAESQNLESALRAVELIMDDDIEGAERGLAEGNSAFHSLCKGVLGFMKATMGFEQEVMKEASEQLSAAETAAYNNHYKAQKDSHAYQSNIYDRGAEFSLCQAEAQIMSAVVGVLNESLTESIKGFYKLRKAYMTLESLIQMENRFMKTQSVRSLANSNQSQDSLRSVKSTMSGVGNGEKEALRPMIPVNGKDVAHANYPSGLRETTAAGDLEDDSDDEFYEVENEEQVTTTYEGHLERESEENNLYEKIASMNISTSRPPTSNSNTNPSPPKHQSATAIQLLTVDANSSIFTSPLDIFVHSGTNLCFGLLSLLISAIPPAFSKLLFIIGFRGDRERGMRMLWQASKFHNINGGMAGLIILGWYNGLVGFCDIIPDPDPSVHDEVEGYPAARLQILLAEMRARYPKSHLWLIEEARMAASSRQLDRSLALLSETPGKSKSTLKQLEALHMFEKALESMHAHRYEQAAKTFLICVDLNNWSQALYYYIAGAAHLEIYRSQDPKVSAKERERSGKLAEEYFKVAPSKAGKKKMMGRQLPFDIFVVRKIAKWTARATLHSTSFISAIGVSPLEEMIFFWNGYKKQSSEHLSQSLANLSWSESQTGWSDEADDEKAILKVLRGVVLRNLRRHDESLAELKGVLSVDPNALKGEGRDDWPIPVAHYEYAVNLWMQRVGYTNTYGDGIVVIGAGSSNTMKRAMSKEDIAHDAALVAGVKKHIETAKNWGRFDLDARVGMKITAAGGAVKNWEGRHGGGKA